MNAQILSMEITPASVEANVKPKVNTSNKSEENFASVLDKAQSTKETNNTKMNTEEAEKNSLLEEQKADKPTKFVASNICETKLANQLLEDLLSEEEVLEAVAHLFQKSTDEIEAILAQLQIGIMDLLQMDNLQQFIMEIYDVHEPMDLLLIPEVSESIKILSGIVEEYAKASLGVVQEETPVIEPIKVTPNNDIPIEENTKPQKIVDENHKSLETKPILADQGVDSVKQKEDLAFDQHQQSTDSGNSKEEFVQNLYQSLTDVLQWQQDQVSQVSETVTHREPLVEPRMILDQVVERIKSSVIDDVAQITIQLKPEHLGRLSMNIVSEQGVMAAQFTVENEKVKAIVEQNIQELREVLENKGMSIEKLEVAVGQNQNEDRQLYGDSKRSRNVSRMIQSLMGDVEANEVLESEPMQQYETSNVNFTA